MKKILLMMYYMNCGGVEQAIINLIKNIDQSKYQVDLLLLEKKGEFLERIPQNVNVLEVPVNNLEMFLIIERNIRNTIKYGFRHKLYFKTFVTALKFLYYKAKKVPSPEYETVFGCKKSVSYDVALDFHGYLSLTTYYVAKKVKSKQKYTWVHSEGFIDNIKLFTPYLNEFNKIFCVSKKCVELVSEELTDYKNIDVFYNFFDVENIKQKANIGENIKKEKDELSILTVGRMSYEKGYDIAIEVAEILKERNVKFKWYFCGDGELFEEIKNIIASKGLEGEIELLGFKNNPYGYMDSCDVYVQTSRYEGNCLTIVEAIILNKMVVTTDVSGAKENIVCGENGFITDMNAFSIADAIFHLYENREKIKDMCTNQSIQTLNAESTYKLNQILKDFN